MGLERFIPDAVQPNASPNWSALDQLLSRPSREAEDKRRFDAEDARANANLKIQQDYQGRKFAKEDQAEIEGLLAELQAARDQGDPEVHARVLQKLQRFGLDVGKPDLQAFTGQKPGRLSTQGLPSLRAPSEEGVPEAAGAAPEADLSQSDFESQLIGEGAAGTKFVNPIDQAVQTELKSREALKARNASVEPDIAGHLASVGGLKPLKLNSRAQQDAEGNAYDPSVSDVTDPGTPSAGDATDVMDLDAPVEKPPARLSTQGLPAGQRAPEAPGRPELPPRPLSTQFGGNVISKGGKVLATESDSAGRFGPMVSSVFEPYANHENPAFAAAGQRAQKLAQKLISVDGISPKDAIEFATKRLENEVTGMNNLERTRIGSAPRKRGGSGGAATALGDLGLTSKELALLGDDADKIMLSLTAKPEYQKVSVMDDVLNGAESALDSDDPVRQQQAISDIMRARSGLTVRKDEEASLQNAMGLWQGLQARLSQKAGYGLTEDYRRQLAAAIAAQRRINQQIRGRLAAEAKKYYETTRTVEGESGTRSKQVSRIGGAIQGMLERGGGGAAAPKEGGLTLDDL